LSRLLLDTHVLVRWLLNSRNLSRGQLRALESAVQRGETLTFSAVTLMEIAVLASGEKPSLKISLDEFLDDLNSDPLLRLLPLDYEIAREISWLSALRDPADRAIVATARVHGLRLVTSDERIIKSGLVQVVD
jgi:PIN domain nuclease of toxin-antitoxin system